MTFDLQNLIRSYLSPSGRLYLIWRIYLKAFLRYYVLNMAQTNMTSQWPWPLNAKILSVHPWVTVNTCAKFEENPSQHSWDIAFTRNTDGRQTRKHNASGPVYCRGRDITNRWYIHLYIPMCAGSPMILCILIYVLWMCGQSCGTSYVPKSGRTKIIRKKISMGNNKCVPVCALHIRHTN